MLRAFLSGSTRILAILVLFLLGAALPAGALQDVSVASETEPGEGDPPSRTTFYETATVRERPLASATGSVTVIDREAIEASGAATVADLLQLVPGLTVTTNATRGGLSTVEIRGGDPNFTQVLIDGVPVNDGTYQVGDVFNLEGLSTDAIESIEIVRGPLSSFYGSTGLAGAVNVLTRRGEPGRPRVEAELGGGDADWRTARASASGGGGRADWFVSAAEESEEGRIAEESFDRLHVQGRLRVDLTDRATLRLATRAASWEADDYPDASGGPVFGSGELRRSDHGEASLGAELLAEGPGGLRHKATASFYRHDLDRTSPAVLPLVPASEESTRFTRARLGWAVTGERGERLRWSLGADVEREEGENESVLFLPPFPGGEHGQVPGDYSLERTTPGAYTEVLLDRGNVLFELGARVDLPEDVSTQVSPRLGASWRPGGGATRWHASAGRAFKLPSFFALASPPALGGNPGLRPEVMVGGDLGVDRDFPAAGARAGLTLFLHRFEDLVDFDFETFSHVNRAEVDARGAELSLDWRPAEAFAVNAAVTRLDVEDRRTGDPLRHRPDWTGALGLDWRPRSDLDLHLDARWIGESVDEQIPVPDRRTVDPYGLVGLRAAWRFAERWQLAARVDNLTDEGYETLVGFPGPGRSARLTLRWAWRED
jgi:vitamin B12 transporter